MFVPSDINITSPLLHRISVLPSPRKYWREMSSRLPIKYLYIHGAEVGYVGISVANTNCLPLQSCTPCLLLKLITDSKTRYMKTTSGACVPSCGSAFCTEGNTDVLVIMERNRWFGTIIFRCDASSSGEKAFPFLDQCVLRSYQPKTITLILILSFKVSSLYYLLFRFFSSLNRTISVSTQSRIKTSL